MRRGGARTAWGIAALLCVLALLPGVVAAQEVAPSDPIVPDALAPDTAIVSGPAALTSDGDATFVFPSPEPGVAFECSLDGAEYSACPVDGRYTTLSEGRHELRVRARDAAENVDLSPAVHIWTIDQTPPETIVDAGPPAETTDGSATFRFAASEAATFACSVDDGPFERCESGVAVAVPEGGHRFRVLATDAAGNVDPTPAVMLWTRRTPSVPAAPALDPPPVLSLSISKRVLRRASYRRGLKAKVGCSEACFVDAWLSLNGKRARRLGLSRKRRPAVLGQAFVQAAPGRQASLTVKLNLRVRKVLRRSRSVRVRLHLRATDAHGNATPLRRRAIRLRR